MFKELVAIEPVKLIESAKKELYKYAENVRFYSDIPNDETEIIKRIGDADGVLLSYTSQITENIFKSCKNIKYVGMCCSLYSEESANVDIAYARKHGITVYGIRDYGDKGVVEFVLCELIRFLHGYDRPMFKEMPIELTGLKTGIIGLGVSGSMIASALDYMGSEVSYYSRSRKSEAENKGIRYRELDELLKYCDVIFTCLNKNVILLNEHEFEILGNHKILFNTSIGPSADTDALISWLACENNYFVCDTKGAVGDAFEKLSVYKNVYCSDASAGMTKQAYGLLSEKVIANIERYIEEE